MPNVNNLNNSINLNTSNNKISVNSTPAPMEYETKFFLLQENENKSFNIELDNNQLFENHNNQNQSLNNNKTDINNPDINSPDFSLTFTISSPIFTIHIVEHLSTTLCSAPSTLLQ